MAIAAGVTITCDLAIENVRDWRKEVCNKGASASKIHFSRAIFLFCPFGPMDFRFEIFFFF